MTREFYQAQSQEVLMSSTLGDYVFYAGGTIQEEYRRSSDFLLQRTRGSVEQVIHECLITQRAE